MTPTGRTKEISKKVVDNEDYHWNNEIGIACFNLKKKYYKKKEYINMIKQYITTEKLRTKVNTNTNGKTRTSTTYLKPYHFHLDTNLLQILGKSESLQPSVSIGTSIALSDLEDIISTQLSSKKDIKATAIASVSIICYVFYIVYSLYCIVYDV